MRKTGLNIKHPKSEICYLIETRMNELVLKINESDSIIESDKLRSELRILNWIYIKLVVTKKTFEQS